jgi:RNA polymerase sigma-70 factor (ECF subfamily)
MTEAATAPRIVEGEDPPAPTAVVDRARSLVVAHFHRIWRLLRRLGVPESDAEDAAQQVFLVATSRLADIPPERERSFVYATALRVASATRRNRARRQKWIELGYEDSISPSPTVDEELERREALAFIDDVLGELEDDLRRIFVLCEIEELTAPEASEVLQIPIGTVASRLRRARHRFDEIAARIRDQRTRDS